jgi:hypothetical protein
MTLAVLMVLGLADLRVPAESRPEEPWQPCPFLRYEDEALVDPSRSVSERTPFDSSSGLDLPRELMTEPYEWRDAIRFFLDPVEAIVGPGTLRGSWDERVKEASVSTSLSRWVEALRTPLGRRIFLGVNVDLLGFEEYEGRRFSMIDPRHGSPRITFLSTGFGLTLGF